MINEWIFIKDKYPTDEKEYYCYCGIYIKYSNGNIRDEKFQKIVRYKGDKKFDTSFNPYAYVIAWRDLLDDPII